MVQAISGYFSLRHKNIFWNFLPARMLRKRIRPKCPELAGHLGNFHFQAPLAVEILSLFSGR